MEFIDIAFPSKIENLSDESLSFEIQHLPNGQRIVPLLHTTAEFLKTLIKSDGYIHYSLDEVFGELYIAPAELSLKEGFSKRYKWNIERGCTIAIYAYKTRTPVLVDSDTSVNLNFPYLQALPGLFPRFILSLPLLDFQDRCFGVVEFYRINGRQYTEIEIKLCQFILKNCAEAMQQNENAVFYSKHNKIQVKLQELLERYTFNDDEYGSYSFSSQVEEMTRECTDAILSSTFFDRATDPKKVSSKIEEFLTSLNNRSVVVADFRATLMERKIKGSLKVCYKKELALFTLLDERLLEGFGKLCTTWCVIEYMSGYLKKQQSLNDNFMSLINLQLQNARDFNKKLQVSKRKDSAERNSWNYGSIIGSCDDEKLTYDIVDMMSYIKGSLSIHHESLLTFVVMVRLCHQSSIIDFQHVVHCVQGLYRLLIDCKKFASKLEALAMIIAILCHKITLTETKTAMSCVFGRYNLYPNELIRFEIVQSIIQGTKLLQQLHVNDQYLVLKFIKEFLVDMNLERFKHNTEKFGELIQSDDIHKEYVQNDKTFRSLLQSLMPGLGNILGHFRSQKFREDFPHFDLFNYLRENDLHCVDIVAAISSK